MDYDRTLFRLLSLCELDQMLFGATSGHRSADFSVAVSSDWFATDHIVLAWVQDPSLLRIFTYSECLISVLASLLRHQLAGGL